jgi:hypothetical protein
MYDSLVGPIQGGLAQVPHPDESLDQYGPSLCFRQRPALLTVKEGVEIGGVAFENRREPSKGIILRHREIERRFTLEV